MTSIQDETKRMVAHTYTAENMCDGNCSECAKDKRLYDGLIETGGSRVFEEVCPLGLALSERIENYAKNNPSKDYIISFVKSLQIDSIGNVNPEKIKRNIKTLRVSLREYHDYSEEKVPTEVNITEIIHIPPRITRRFQEGLFNLL